MSLLQSTSLPSPISTFFTSAELLPTTQLLNQLYPIKSANTLWCQACPILLSSQQPDVFAHLPAKWVAQHAQNLPWNWWFKKFLAKSTSRSYQNKTGTRPVKAQSERVKLPSNHDRRIVPTLYPLLWVYLDAYLLPQKQLPVWNNLENWKPLSTLPEEIHLSKFEDL